MRKIIFLNFALFLLIWVVQGAVSNQTTKCPERTTAGYRFITFVGKVGLGGDKEVKVWFEYGNSEKNLNRKTKILTLDKEGIFCLRENRNIRPCTLYYYRAAAQNSAGTNYGEIKSITTLCSNKNIEQQNKTKTQKWIIF